jgi:acetyl-CoA synthetase
MVPGTVGRPLPGIDARVVDADGEEVEPGEAGYLVFERPWPGMFRPMEHNVKQVVDDWTEFGDPHAGEWVYFSEDGATIDTEGNITILGRLDDVLNVGNFSKNRVHTHEIEEVVRDIDGVASATVVVGDHDVKGEAPYAFVVPDTTFETGTRGLRGSILRRVKDELSPMARPEQIYFVPALPRTDSGTVLHRVLEDLVNNDQLGDTGALRNPEVLDLIAVEVRFATDQ